MTQGDWILFTHEGGVDVGDVDQQSTENRGYDVLIAVQSADQRQHLLCQSQPLVPIAVQIARGVRVVGHLYLTTSLEGIVLPKSGGHPLTP